MSMIGSGPLPEAPRLGGSGPFVINLSASTSPIAVPAASMAAGPHARVYQIKRIEDHRTRYRLRIGSLYQTEDRSECRARAGQGGSIQPH